MDSLKEILHIDKDWRITYILIRKGSIIKSSVTMEIAIRMLEKITFDLVLSEPQNMAILTPENENTGLWQEMLKFNEEGNPCLCPC